METENITPERMISLPIDILLVVSLTQLFLHITLNSPEQNKIFLVWFWWKEISFFQKRYLIKSWNVACIYGCHGSEIAAKMNKHTPPPQKKWCPDRHSGCGKLPLAYAYGDPSGEWCGRHTRALVLKVWSSTSHISTTWNLSEIHRPTESKTLRVGSSCLGFHKLSRWFWCKLKFENHWPRALHTGLRVGKPWF